MTCLECKGACCEVFTLVCRSTTNDPTYYNWLKKRAAGELPGERLVFDARCPSLGEDGLCRDYACRPQACIDFPMGGPECREVVRLRRPWGLV